MIKLIKKLVALELLSCYFTSEHTHWQALTPVLVRNSQVVSSFQLRKQK